MGSTALEAMFQHMTISPIHSNSAKPSTRDSIQADSQNVTREAPLRGIWDRVRRKLRAELGDDVVASWFGSLELSGIDGGVARMTVPTRFLKSWIDTHYAARLRRHFATDGHATSVEVTVRGEGREAGGAKRGVPRRTVDVSPNLAGAPAASGSPRGASEPQPWQGRKPHEMSMQLSALDRHLTFDNFVVGRSNQFACAAARKVSETIGGQSVYNPLYIHAAVGLGKTHLSQAVAHACQAEGKRALYLTADRFMHSFVSALRSQTAIQFKDQMRNIDLLIVDDVQFLQGKTVQQEFCHIINALADARRQMVVAADRPPTELEGLDERIKSRLGGGLCVEIGAFDEDLRRRILARRIAAATERDASFRVPQEVIDFVASVITSNGRDLDGAVNRLLAHANLAGAPMTLESAEVAIRDLIRAREPKRVRVEEILKLVSAHFNVTRADLLSSRRTASVVRPRQIAMYLSKTLTLRSLPEIGRRFGGRDHTTVLHAVRKVESLIGNDPALKDEIALLKRMLTE
jgi:chromosomal replication initiator protein